MSSVITPRSQWENACTIFTAQIVATPRPVCCRSGHEAYSTEVGRVLGETIGDLYRKAMATSHKVHNTTPSEKKCDMHEKGYYGVGLSDESRHQFKEIVAAWMSHQSADQK